MNNTLLNYISTQKAAKQWNIPRKQVLALCQAEKIPNIMRIGNIWLIPDNTTNPKNRYSKHINLSPHVKPFVKWVGGKTQLLEKISVYIDKLPSMKKYAEPFVGGGALFFNMLTKYSIEQAYISDINAELINTYTNIRDNIESLIDKLYKMEKLFLIKDLDKRNAFYLLQRKKFNSIKLNNKSEKLEKAALFIFLNKTCFNGLYRVNSKGKFNVPVGSYKNPQICDKDNLQGISKLLQKVTIVCGDYKESFNFIDKNTFVYFDPPYRPLNNTSNFTSYTAGSFNDEHQKELAKYINCLNIKGAKILISNSDPKNHNSKDMFFDKLYSKYNIKRVLASRMINCKGNSRGQLTELLISNF
jgi:DNA adenine methylase